MNFDWSECTAECSDYEPGSGLPPDRICSVFLTPTFLSDLKGLEHFPGLVPDGQGLPPTGFAVEPSTDPMPVDGLRDFVSPADVVLTAESSSSLHANMSIRESPGSMRVVREKAKSRILASPRRTFEQDCIIDILAVEDVKDGISCQLAPTPDIKERGVSRTEKSDCSNSSADSNCTTGSLPNGQLRPSLRSKHIQKPSGKLSDPKILKSQASMRASHNNVEKNYRNRLKDKFAELSDVLARMETSNNYNGGSNNEKKTPNKGKVLFLAKQRLLTLQMENHALSDEVRRLGRSLRAPQRIKVAEDAVYAPVIFV